MMTTSPERAACGRRDNVSAILRKSKPLRKATFARMWQRKQTLFLVVAIALAASLYFLRLADYQRVGLEGLRELRLDGIHDVEGSRVEPSLAIPLVGLNALLIALLIACVVLFRNRQRQLRLIRLAFLFSLGILVAVVFTHNSVASAMGSAASVTSTLKFGAYIPFVLPVLIWLAERGIKKDEELVKSADRLR